MKGIRKEPDANGHLWLCEGEYGKGADGVWYARPPGTITGAGSLAKHMVTEHEDGTITVSPSILMSNGQVSWHGFLENGIWRQA